MKFLSAALLAAFTISSGLGAVERSEIRARDGVLDLSQTEINETDTWALDGEWRFYWHDFISPAGNSAAVYPVNITVRGTWKGVMQNGEPLPSKGWGSYALLLRLGKTNHPLALRMPNIGTAYRLYANGNLIAASGVPAADSAEAIPMTLPQTALLPAADAAGRILLVMHISNHDDRHGGIWQTIRLGRANLAETKLRNEYILAAFLCGAFILIGLHHFLMFARQRQDKSHLAFALLCLLLALRALAEGNRLLLVLLPDFPWVWNSRFSYLTFYGAVPLGAWFLRSVFPKQFHRFALAAVLVVSVPASIVLVVTPPQVYTETLSAFQAFALLMILYSLYVIVRAVAAKERGSKTLAVGLTTLFFCATVDILTVANVLNWPELAPFGLMAFIISQSVLLSIRQEDAYRSLELLAAENRELISSMELKIIERTATIAELSAEGDAVLNSLGEGVFLVNRDKIVGNKFSRKIFEILELEPEEIAGKSFAEIILRITGEAISEDARIFLNVLFNPLMDDETVAELNPLHKITIRGLISGQNRILTFHFTRQRRRNDIMGVFVSCRDITADEQLRTELEDRETQARKQLEIVRTLFSVRPEVLQTFYGSIETEIEEIDAALNPENDISPRERTEQVYRAAHTIKGSAQLFRIDFVAHEAHVFEEKMQGLLEKETLENIDLLGVNIAYSEMQKSLEEFEGMIARILKFQKEAGSMHLNAIDLLRESLPRMVTEISTKLGKKAEIRFENFTPESIPRRYAAALRDSLVQCVRNALAHSIETAEERLAAGKSEMGSILVSVTDADDALNILVRDDGRSFDLEAIRRRALERGLTTGGALATLKDQEVINFIFSAGFSTAEPGGAIAGRGAGMDVILRKTRQLGGKIRINWIRGKFTEFTFSLPKK